MASKRERSTNWEKQEKQLLREVIKPYLGIIENKDLTTNSNKAKVRAWTELTEKFNFRNIRIRDKKQIINQWKITKHNSRKELFKYRHEGVSKTLKEDFNKIDCDGVKEEEENTKVTIDIEEIADVNPMAKEKIDEGLKKSNFNFAEASFADMHHFRLLENERVQKEHELRMEQMAELHSQLITNLKLQQEILTRSLASYTNK